MKSSRLTIKQATILRDNIGGSLQYLAKLKKRMEALRFPADDPLLREVREAHEVVSRLWIRLHYLSCKSGVGLSERTEKRGKVGE